MAEHVFQVGDVVKYKGNEYHLLDSGSNCTVSETNGYGVTQLIRVEGMPCWFYASYFDLVSNVGTSPELDDLVKAVQAAPAAGHNVKVTITKTIEEEL